MDHAHHMMGHSDMDMGHGGHDMPNMDMCAMSMLFTWNTKNLCIVFESWHIRSTAGLIFSLLAVILIGMGYEALRAGTRRYEIVMRRRVDSTPRQNKTQANKRVKLIKAVMYATQTFYAFMLMLIFMTYNGWVMVAVTLGAFLGYFVFGDETAATKETQCH
ncbi:copper transpport protein [Gnomoniopsis sp. IMI 355080]|nr:copper transpport protein [Gnomoniopsis sp. IMI 355080]